MLENLPFSHWIAFAPAVHICTGLFLGSLFCSLHLFVYLCVNIILFWLLQHDNKSWNHVVLAFWLHSSFFWSYFGYFRPFIFPHEFQPISTKKARWDFDWFWIKSIDPFRENWHHNNVESSEPWMSVLSIYLGLFQFLSAVFCGFQCVDFHLSCLIYSQMFHFLWWYHKCYIVNRNKIYFHI